MLKKLICLITLVIINLNGCVTAMIEDDRQRTVTEAALLGGGSGALIGGLLGEFVKGQPVLGAIVGAVLGTTAGGAYGNHVANKKAEFASQEAYLDACILEAEQILQQTKQYNRALRGDIRSLNLEVNKLVNAYYRKQLTKIDLEEKQHDIQARFKEATEQLKRATDELLIQQEVRRREQQQPNASIAQLDAKITQLERNVYELGQYTQALASINQRLEG